MISENIERLKERIENACKKVSRLPNEITIVAACKKVEPEKIEEAVRCGIKIIGENTIQEAIYKKQKVSTEVEWHMIGHLQRNKVKKALELFSMIQSVDSVRLAEEINKRAINPIPVLIEVNTSGEETKFGFKPNEVIENIKIISKLKNVKILGLMTIGPLNSETRESFILLRKLKEKIEKEKIDNVEMKWLSMGMTDDFEIAIEEGSNMIRIGRAIFGEREYWK